MKHQISCPICKHKLFDIEEKSIGVIVIKCTRCRKTSKIRLQNQALNNLRPYNFYSTNAISV